MWQSKPHDIHLRTQTTQPEVNLAHQDETHSGTGAAEHNCQDCCYQIWSQLGSSKTEILPANDYEADVRTSRQASSLTTHDIVSHLYSSTRHKHGAATDDTKLNNWNLGIIIRGKTHRVLSAFGQLEEGQRAGNEFGDGGNAGSNGNYGQHSTALGHFEVKVVVGEPKWSPVQLLLMRKVQIGHIQLYSQALCQRRKEGYATGVSYHRLGCEKHQCATQSTKMTWSGGHTDLGHDCQPQWANNGTNDSKLKYSAHR